MLRDDLDSARSAWLSAAGDVDERMRREQSDKNHDGESIDFHALRHTCGAWLALAGEHPKVVQTVMRHGSITLTMDTYGHLFPGQEAQAAGRLGDMLTAPDTNAMRATGTDDATSDGAQRQAQRAGRETLPDGVAACERSEASNAQQDPPKPLVIADLGDEVPDDARECKSAPSRTRTLNLLIKSSLADKMNFVRNVA